MQVIGVEDGKVGIVLTLAEMQMIAAALGGTNQKETADSVERLMKYYGSPLYSRDGDEQHPLWERCAKVLADHHNASWRKPLVTP